MSTKFVSTKFGSPTPTPRGGFKWGAPLANAWSPYRAPKPQNRKRNLVKSEKCHFRPPRKNGPKSQLKCPKSPFLDILIPQKWTFGAIFPGGLKWHFRTLKGFFCGFGVSGLCRGTGRLRGESPKPPFPPPRLDRVYHSSQKFYRPTKKYWGFFGMFRVRSLQGETLAEKLAKPSKFCQIFQTPCRFFIIVWIMLKMACASLLLVLSRMFERNVLKPLESCTIGVVCKNWFWSVPWVGGLCRTWSHMQHTSPQSTTLESCCHHLTLRYPR